MINISIVDIGVCLMGLWLIHWLLGEEFTEELGGIVGYIIKLIWIIACFIYFVVLDHHVVIN
jgi:hypothetical protein